VQAPNPQCWRELCEAAAREENFQQYLRLLERINLILEYQDCLLAGLLQDGRVASSSSLVH
jgi:hypothetical protein